MRILAMKVCDYLANLFMDLAYYLDEGEWP